MKKNMDTNLLRSYLVSNLPKNKGLNTQEISQFFVINIKGGMSELNYKMLTWVPSQLIVFL